MKKRRDLIAYLKLKSLRMTPLKELLIQFFIDNQKRQIPIKELQEYVSKHIPDFDRTTLYRNIEKFIEIDLIQELNLPKTGKIYQFVFDRKIYHYFICKGCEEVKKGDEILFKQIEDSLKKIHGFMKANLSVVFYGYCAKCDPQNEKE
ncbi:MAG: Fur family transcriptional regulator [Pseudobdellovibrionaceae bacterium]